MQISTIIDQMFNEAREQTNRKFDRHCSGYSHRHFTQDGQKHHLRMQYRRVDREWKDADVKFGTFLFVNNVPMKRKDAEKFLEGMEIAQ